MNWFYDYPRSVVKDKQNTMISHYKSAAKSAKNSILKLVKKLDKLADR